MDELRNVFESAYDRLFTEIVNIDSIPKDYDENELFFRIPEIFDSNINDNKESRMFLRKKIDKRDKDELKRIIENRLTEYIEERPEKTAEMYRDSELMRLHGLQSGLCPNWKGLHQKRQFEIYHDIEAYKEALLELVPGESLMKSLLTESNDEHELPEIDIATQKEQIRFLNDLGVFDFLIKTYPATLKGNNSQLSRLVASMLKLEYRSVQPTINALINDNATNKNYPKETPNTKAIIDQLKANESI